MLISLEDLSLLPRLPDDVVAALTAGAVFMKKDRMGREAPRMVALSRDMTTLSWSAVGGTESSRGSQQAAPLSAYVRYVIRTSSQHLRRI